MDYVNVDDYRKYLENYYIWACQKDEIEERKKLISKWSDDKLQKIIDDTLTFSNYVIEKLKECDDKHIYVEIELTDADSAIKSNLIGGYFPDILSHPIEFDSSFYISHHLFEEFFKNFSINFYNYEETEYYDELSESGNILENRFLYIQGTKENLDKICNNKVKTFKKQ